MKTFFRFCVLLSFSTIAIVALHSLRADERAKAASSATAVRESQASADDLAMTSTPQRDGRMGPEGFVGSIRVPVQSYESGRLGPAGPVSVAALPVFSDKSAALKAGLKLDDAWVHASSGRINRLTALARSADDNSEE